MKIYQIWNDTHWILTKVETLPIGVHPIKIQEVSMEELFKIKGRENELKNTRISRSSREDANSSHKEE